MTSRAFNFSGVTLAALLALSSAFTFAQADDILEGDILEPGLGKSYVVGTKNAVTYFEKVGGACLLTIMIGDVNPNKGDAYVSAARVKVSVAPGKSTDVDSAEGQSINFKCNSDAATMDVQKRFFGSGA